MATILLLVAALASQSNPGRSGSPAVRIFPASVGLIIVATTPEGIAIGADSASSNADGTLSQAEKVFPISKTAVVAIAGAVSLQDPVSRPVREEVNVARIAAAWLAAHPNATLDIAGKEINDAVAGATTRYFSSRAAGSATRHYSFALIFAGMVDGKAVIRTTRYYMPAGSKKPMRTETTSEEAKPGEFWMFGQAQVAQKLVQAGAGHLAPFSGEAPVKKLHSAQPADLTLQDHMNVIDVLLRASESSQAKRTAVKPAVAPPNKLMVLRNEGAAAVVQKN